MLLTDIPPVTAPTSTWGHLDACVRDLIDTRGELAELLMAERRERIEAFETSRASSVSAGDRYADVATLNLSTDIINIKNRIKQLEDTREMLTLAITHNVTIT